MKRYTLVLILVFLAAVASVASIANADIVTLKDGTVYEGVITKETGAQVTMTITIANIKTTKTFPRYKVKTIERTAVESTTDDDKASTKKTSKPTTRARPTRSTKKTSPKPNSKASSSATRYIVIPVQGMIGVDTNASGLEKVLQLAVRKKVKHIVFEIDSPGGYIYDAVETLKVLKKYDAALNYHALVEAGAISAASVYVAAADDIFVRPDARVGGAVSYTKDNTSGSAQVDAKLNSIWAAEIAARAESKGYPAEIFRAMVVIDAQVWMDKDGNIFSSRPTGSVGAQQIDSPRTILTIRAAQMVQAGMAKEFTGPINQLGELLDISEWDEIKGIGSRSMSKSAKERISLSEKMEFAKKIYDDTIVKLEKHHPATFSDYVRFIYRRRLTPYNTQNLPSRNAEAQDAQSLNLWRERSNDAINDCDIIIEALAEMAAANKAAQRIGALHIVMSSKLGDERYQAIDALRAWLYANINRIPFKSDGTIEAGPQI